MVAFMAACPSPKSYTGLSDGSHTFSVRAKDAATDVGASRAEDTGTIDTTPPDTTIATKPSNPSNSAAASFTFSSENADRLESLDTAADLRIADLIRSALSRRTRIPGQQYKVFLLSEANDTRTVQLQNDVKNSTLSSAGKPAAWTQSQRYTRISALQLNPPTTGALASQLIAPGDHPSPQSQ